AELVNCVAMLRSLHLLAETIVTAQEIFKTWTLLGYQIEACEAFATALARAFAFDKRTIGAVRAACAALGQLKLLPGHLWPNRSDEVLAEENFASLHDAATRC